MKHIKLFENFDPSAAKVSEMIDALRQDSQMGHYSLSVNITSDIPMVVWDNPADDESWRESGYGEDYDGDFSDVPPMNVLAILNINDELFAYKLTPEEKYYGVVISDEDGYDEDQLVKIDSVEDFKRALHESIWEMA
jgi:hypothetical protein